MNNSNAPKFESKWDKIAEVEALMRLYGYSLAAACELVCLDPAEYRPTRGSSVNYLPTPKIIRSECSRFRRLSFDPSRVVDRARLLQAFDESFATPNGENPAPAPERADAVAARTTRSAIPFETRLPSAT